MRVQQWIRDNKHSLVWSAMLDFENQNNPDEERSKSILAWKRLAETDLDTTPAIEQIAVQIERLGLKTVDALHIASAIAANADRFLTTDKGILGKMKAAPDETVTPVLTTMIVMDPIDFIREQEGISDEN